MSKSLRAVLTAAVAAAVTIPAGSAFAWSNVVFLDGPLPPNSVASSSSWRDTVGGEININLTHPWGLVYGRSHIDTITTAGVQFQAESNGSGANMTHVQRANAWNRCWWAATSGSGGSVSAQCASRVP